MAELGQFALAETRLDKVMNRATGLVSQTLAVACCEVLEASDEPVSGADGKEAAALEFLRTQGLYSPRGASGLTVTGAMSAGITIL